MSRLQQLADRLSTLLGDAVLDQQIALEEITFDIAADQFLQAAQKLHDDSATPFTILLDVCGVDYQGYGAEGGKPWAKSRFATVYHLLSIAGNERIRLRVQLDDNAPEVDSVINIWPGADWFEREAFDMFGIVFRGHPDLRRILSDYGFIGHPLRKDFPLSGNVEMRYDEDTGRVVYEPVSIEPRILVPRSIREDKPHG